MEDPPTNSRAALTAVREEAVARLAATQAELVTLRDDRSDANDDDEHDPDGATLSAEWSRLTGLADAARARLAQVDDALARLDAGDYGICQRCGQPIPAGRLEVRPFAEYCLPCAERTSQ
ncbi:TraR/DksA family transcriptional regulator [Cumulibacter soli]|uniref:TraR/DksA family transcriptional regulator n=1 Tax=Cumulibacter soli TaxID=2546344 RepID=UPI001068C903|nr:TraR/DksA C4-type zinc finger protein [Cumulibacter soli]